MFWQSLSRAMHLAYILRLVPCISFFYGGNYHEPEQNVRWSRSANDLDTSAQNWLQEWYGISYEPQMKPGDMQQMEKLAATSGEEFEIMFMEMLIKHHEQAIKRATKCTELAYHNALANLCENIIATQQVEIEQMQTWLCDWYGICKE